MATMIPVLMFADKACTQHQQLQTAAAECQSQIVKQFSELNQHALTAPDPPSRPLLCIGKQYVATVSVY
mgnify:CR=1 FL=1